MAQNATIPEAGTYTLSAYVKTSGISTSAQTGGAGLAVDFLSGTLNGQSVSSEKKVRGTSNAAVDNGWERVILTFNVPDAGTNIRVMGGIFGLSGTAWFDCFQLEKGGSANAFNLVNNAGFERAGGSSSIQAWEKYNTSAGDGRVSGGHDGSYGAVLQGTPSTRKYFR